MVALGGFSVEDAPRYPGLGLHFPHDGEVYIYAAQIDAGLRFPLCEDLQTLCQFYGIHPTQLVPNALRMWVGFKFLCIRQEWAYSLVLFRCFFRLAAGANHLHHFQSRWPKFAEWGGPQAWSWNAHVRLVDDFRATNSNYKKFYFFYKGCVPWKLFTPDKDFPPSFEELSGSDRNAIDDLYRLHRSSPFKSIRSVAETTENMLEMAGIHQATQIFDDWVTF